MARVKVLHCLLFLFSPKKVKMLQCFDFFHMKLLTSIFLGLCFGGSGANTNPKPDWSLGQQPLARHLLARPRPHPALADGPVRQRVSRWPQRWKSERNFTNSCSYQGESGSFAFLQLSCNSHNVCNFTVHIKQPQWFISIAYMEQP